MTTKFLPGMVWDGCVTVGPYNVGGVSGSGIDGYQLHVFIYHGDKPNEWGGKGVIEDIETKSFPGPLSKGHAAADEYCLRKGYLQPWYRFPYEANKCDHCGKEFEKGSRWHSGCILKGV